MFTLRQLLREVKIGCTNPITHVREMRLYAEAQPEDAAFCVDVICTGCNVRAQAERWLGLRDGGYAGQWCRDMTIKELEELLTRLGKERREEGVKVMFSYWLQFQRN